MSTTGPTRRALVTATTVADAPGARRPRSHTYGRQVPCEVLRDTSRVRKERGSFTLRPFTSAAATEERFVTVIVHLIRPPTGTAAGSPFLTTSRSSSGLGSGGVGGIGVGGSGVGSGGSGGFGGVVPCLTFVNRQTTTSPFLTVTSNFVPGAESSTVPLRAHTIVES